ncbi:AAA family ATPase [Flavobacterium wongokense]|uniref:AAA family ATPase n=1 Tax=Flavobacterium wongokense TaxID=2910674 RepID=UPI001F3DD74A|nr:AAA family ATPase [Flavobacterium sp. WG47]MCF6133104.1 ATP-binding protein [Flavobacterium sp. WG47]
MKFKKFIINGYRGISEITEIDISKESLIPIIGKNESGKTTFLEAVFAFDHFNDSRNGGRHLDNVTNLYSTAIKPVIVSAEIEYNGFKKIENIFEESLKKFTNLYSETFDAKFSLEKIDFNDDSVKLENWEEVKGLKILKQISSSNNLVIDRDLKTKKYSIKSFEGQISEDVADKICREIVRKLPYVLYFDDFHDRLPEELPINEDGDSDWIEYIEELFKQTDASYSVYDLPNREQSVRYSIISDVQQELNSKLLEEWSKYKFEKTENISVKIDYLLKENVPHLIFNIVEIILVDGKPRDRHFKISHRSKGFYWYINFMIKLHYNHDKREEDDKDTVYLLDEPGSYLHTFALNKLVEQLKNLSIKNKVIYCTHSHNLLNPEFVPINSIRLAEKNKDGKIVLDRLNHKGIVRPKNNSAYQSIFDALEVRPPLIEFDYNNIVLLEGIYDYYCFKMFTGDKLTYFPCVSASSVLNQIPYMIFLGKKYLALWDNDSEGRARLKKAVELFGEVEGRKFMTLDLIEGKNNTKLEDYFDLSEVQSYSDLKDLSNKDLFCKFVLSLFYSKNREKIINKHFKNTKSNFKTMETKLIGSL